MTVGNVISAIEAFAPAALQADWDNTGLQIGSRMSECTGVLVCVDVTEQIVIEAAERGCNLVVSHHPLFFRGIKRLTGRTRPERIAVEAVRRGVAVYAAHTSLDSCRGGVSWAMASMLGAEVTGVLSPIADHCVTVTAYAPRSLADDVTTALLDVASGATPGLDVHAFATEGSDSRITGNPDDIIGHTPLCAVTVEMPSWRLSEAEATLRQLADRGQLTWSVAQSNTTAADLGLGVTATFAKPLSGSELIERVKAAFGSPVVRCSCGPAGSPEAFEGIRYMAMCGGAGGEFIPTAIARGAQAYLCSDVRYHDFVDHGSDILLLDIGHFESEQCAKRLLCNAISEKIPNFAVNISEIETNPINYL